MQAIDGVMSAMEAQTYGQVGQTDERYNNEDIHFHLTDGQELTIIAGLYDLEMHLTGELEDSCAPVPVEECVTYRLDGSFAILDISHPEPGRDATLRIRTCDDPTCRVALIDYWL
jgi:hypothetical protein